MRFCTWLSDSKAVILSYFAYCLIKFGYRVPKHSTYLLWCLTFLSAKIHLKSLQRCGAYPLKHALIYSLLKMNKIHFRRFKDLQKSIHSLSSETQILSRISDRGINCIAPTFWGKLFIEFCCCCFWVKMGDETGARGLPYRPILDFIL